MCPVSRNTPCLGDCFQARGLSRGSVSQMQHITELKASRRRHLDLCLCFSPEKGTGDRRGCPRSHSKHRLFPVSVEIELACPPSESFVAPDVLNELWGLSAQKPQAPPQKPRGRECSSPIFSGSRCRRGRAEVLAP